MSFRGRLLLFFLMIVVLPMIVVGVLVVSITNDSRTGKADSAVAAGLRTALSLDSELLSQSQNLTQTVAASPDLADALRDNSITQSLLSRLAKENELQFLSVERKGDITDTGNGPAIAVSSLQITGDQTGSIQGSVSTAERLAHRLRNLTGEGIAIVSGDRAISSNLPDGVDLPTSGKSVQEDVSDASIQIGAAELPNSDGLRVVVSTPIESEGFLGSSPLVAIALAGFFVIALILIFFVVAAMRGQIAAMLSAARRIGDGDFSQKVPVAGKDELAGLATEFNKMSDRLEAQINELRQQRLEIDRSLQRLGEAIATGLDRGALIEIVVETAIAACDAEFGRVALSDGTVITKGNQPNTSIRDAVRGAELDARGGISANSYKEAHAIAAPLVRIGTDHALGVISVAREGEPFGRNQRDVLLYLAGQASASISNIEEAQAASEQAVTDELTGLSNRRAFAEWMDAEVARCKRFGHELSLVMIDLDDFKRVNDTFGHLQGDEVLKAIGRILAAESRAIDNSSRYGGEEFAIALPETGQRGASEQAERLRELIETERVPMEDGQVMHVTASFGTATAPTLGDTVRELIAAADAALYSAKHSGKNRVAVQTERVEPGPELKPHFE